jgi:hypothetical protein
MMRKKVIALLAVVSVGLAMPTMAVARGGGGLRERRLPYRDGRRLAV